MDCIFCKIAQGELPSEKIYEDDKVLAFLDINPVNNGHTLLITKDHYENFLSLPDDLMSYVFKKAKLIAQAVSKGTDSDGFNLGINNGSAAGQMIFHCHLHIIPRKENDGIKMWPGKEYQDGEIKKVSEEIKKFIR
jgi:histidine triad (HIT) family protein